MTQVEFTTDRFDTQAMLADLATLVACESPSHDTEALQRSADEVAALGTRLLGRAPQRHGVHLRWTFGDPRVLLLGHHDTVWPMGTIDRWPFTVDDDRATGPGCFDMKAGIVMVLHALARLSDLDGVAVLLTGDEEVGAPTSRDLIVDTARGLEATLVAEPSAGGSVKYARKGTRQFQLHVAGRASHAGLDPEQGVNAGVELAHQLVAVDGWDLPDDLTLVPTVLTAGTTSNTVPASASASLDMRAWEVADLDLVEQRLRALSVVDQDAVLTLERTHDRPPLAAESSASLLALAESVAADLGMPPLPSTRVGGVSDGNFTAAAGVPTLDGLGAIGGGAHAEGEWISVDSMGQRGLLVSHMVQRLLVDGSAA